MDDQRRVRERLVERASIGMLINHPIYIPRFVATDNRPCHSRPGNLNFGNGHTVLARILSVYRFHTHPPPFTPCLIHLKSFCQPVQKKIFPTSYHLYLHREFDKFYFLKGFQVNNHLNKLRIK